jgi:hypothetical protein
MPNAEIQDHSLVSRSAAGSDALSTSVKPQSRLVSGATKSSAISARRCKKLGLPRHFSAEAGRYT